MEQGKKYLSVIVPVLNEEENLYQLHSSLQNVLEKISEEYEIIFVDDGSTDNSYQIMTEIYNEDKHVKIIKFKVHFGQSAGLDAAFNYAKGDIIITIDADLQNDPVNILDLLEALKDFDIVIGYRNKRQDPFTKRVPSKIYNWLARRILKVNLHDLNCGLKAFKKEALQDIKMMGEMHRYTPILAAWRGFRVGEVNIKHHPRKHGKSKYGFTRLFKGLIDMLTVKFLISYSTRPAHIFGFLGIALSMIGFITGLYLVILKYLYHVGIGDRPLLLLTILLFFLGIQMTSFGMMAEMTSRILYRVKKDKPYTIQEILDH